MFIIIILNFFPGNYVKKSWIYVWFHCLLLLVSNLRNHCQDHVKRLFLMFSLKSFIVSGLDIYVFNPCWVDFVNSVWSVQFICSVMSDSVTLWTATCQASLSITNSRSLLKLMSIESVMPSNHLILYEQYEKCTIGSNFVLFTCGYSVFPIPFVEKTVLSWLCILGSLVKDQLTVCMWVVLSSLFCFNGLSLSSPLPPYCFFPPVAVKYTKHKITT